MNDRSWGLQASSRLALGRHVLDLAAGELLQEDGSLAPLRRQALELLLVLGRRNGQVVTKEELNRLVWPDVVVGEGSLTQAISDIRRVLGDEEHRLVRTVARRGYLLAATAAAGVAAPSAPASIDEAPAATVGGETGPFGEPRPHAEDAALPRRWGVALMLLVAVLVAALWATRGLRPATPAGPFSLAVLPLALEGGGAEDRWFAEVLHADLIAHLGQLSGVLVISRETAVHLGRSEDPRVQARALGVRYLVGGAVRRDGDRVRLRIVMSDGDTGAQPWSQQFELPRAELRPTLDTIARQLARTLQVQMYRASGQKALALPPGRLQADDIAMQGWAHYFKGMSPANLKAALERFDAALAEDPHSIRAWGGVEAASGMAGMLGWMPRDVALARLQEAARQLQALDEDDFYTHNAKMFIAAFQSDWEAMLHTASVAAERFPSHPAPHTMRAGALAALGRYEECVEAGRRAVQIGPRDYAVGASHMYIGTCRFMQGRYAEAEAAARAGQAANPLLPSPPVLRAAALVQQGRMEPARALVADYLRRHPSYRAEDIARFLRGRDPSYLAGRERLIESLRAAGMP